jgi:predicted lipoprotein with Yx(FWY)xxD motif
VDACAAAWPPFAGGARSADAAVRPEMVGTTARPDTGRQTTYNGMPVYYYEDDHRAGDVEGQGKLEFGGRWYLVSPSGRAITAAAPHDR